MSTVTERQRETLLAAMQERVGQKWPQPTVMLDRVQWEGVNVYRPHHGQVTAQRFCNIHGHNLAEWVLDEIRQLGYAVEIYSGVGEDDEDDLTGG